MKTIILILLAIFFLGWMSRAVDKKNIIASGEQPQISVDNKGTIRVVFGDKDKIFCSTSNDKGISFSSPVLVAEIADMHLGCREGPNWQLPVIIP